MHRPAIATTLRRRPPPPWRPLAGWPAQEAPAVAGACAVLPRRRLAAAAAAAQQRNPRRSKFDLPVERVEESAPSRFRLAEPEDDGVAKVAIALDKVTAQDVAQQWPPQALVAPEPEVLPVKRPHLWLEDQSQVGFEDVGRYVKLQRDLLLELLPEGPCGELARDLALVIERNRPIGLMLRKLTIELIMQLQELRDATDASGAPRIPKSGFLLDGRRGVGKSMILNLLVMWARRNGWLVVIEPNPRRYSHEIADIKRSNCGVYIQNEFAQQFLEATSIANRQMLEEIQVDRSVYGSRAIDGEPLHVAKRLYDPLIHKAVDQEVADITDEGLREVERLQRIAGYRKQVKMPSMAEQLKEPMNVWEIVEFGLDNQAYATQAVAEMFAQLQRQTTHPVLVVVDAWNECFPVSEYVSVRYDNTRFHGHIPAYHLTMPRALHRWDGHLYRRGLKICATSWCNYARRDFKPELLDIKDHEIRTVRPFCQHEFGNYVAYLRMMNVLHNFPREDLDYFYMMTQGNGYQARKLLATLY